MVLKTKHRQFIHYALIASIILIQLIVLVFFYNEYFNEKKLNEIENQIKKTRILKSLTDNSKEELLNAQSNLQNFINHHDKNYLETYFYSLRNLSKNIDSINTYENIDSETIDKVQLGNFQKLIDSTYQISQKPIPKKENPKIDKFEIKNEVPKLDIEIVHVSDSTEKKKFFPRIKDAIKGNVDVKRDTTIIITKYNNEIDTSKIKADLDSSLNSINKHYINEIKKYETHISVVGAKNENLYQIYDKLLTVSNDLMQVYHNKVQDFNSDLEKEYFEQNSSNNKIRRNAILGLMFLMFFVLGVLIYYTKLTFLYEKELKEANHQINQNLKFKNRILGMLSHEVRAPLKIINIFIQRIKKKTDDDEITNYLNSIEFSNNSLQIQAHQILEYTKNQEKMLELNPIQFDLKQEIQSILDIFEPYIESRNNLLFTQNSIPNQTLVFADKTKIHQIFINVLGNANKFTENGKIDVSIHISNQTESQLKLHVQVADTGIGISESDLNKIFEPYYQGMISDEIDNFGAGLGLNLCKEIIQLFNGTISAESKPGKGTKISFEINLTVSS